MEWTHNTNYIHLWSTCLCYGEHRNMEFSWNSTFDRLCWSTVLKSKSQSAAHILSLRKDCVCVCVTTNPAHNVFVVRNVCARFHFFYLEIQSLETKSFVLILKMWITLQPIHNSMLSTSIYVSQIYDIFTLA